MSTTEPHLTVKEVCDRLRISRTTVWRHIRSGELEAIKGPGPKGFVRISETSLASYIAQHSHRPVETSS